MKPQLFVRSRRQCFDAVTRIIVVIVKGTRQNWVEGLSLIEADGDSKDICCLFHSKPPGKCREKAFEAKKRAF